MRGASLFPSVTNQSRVASAMDSSFLKRLSFMVW
jgi:hypothetical protein